MQVNECVNGLRKIRDLINPEKKKTAQMRLMDLNPTTYHCANGHDTHLRKVLKNPGIFSDLGERDQISAGLAP